jgi:hypothetical protein
MMSSLIADPEHWRDRADEACALAAQIDDPVAQRAMLVITEGYEIVAKRAEERAQRQT